MSADAARAYGPSAFGGGLRRFVELTLTLARTDFKLRYFGSVLGYIWSLMRPLLFFGVLYFFFTKILNVGKGVPHYGVYLLTGIVLWTFFSEATGNSVNCLLAREALLRKMRFPRMVIPLAVSLTAAFNLAMNSIVVVIFAIISGIKPTVRWLEMFPIVFGFVGLATGIGMLLSALYVRFRDVAPIWEVASLAWFYCSPVMYLATNYGHRFGSAFAHLAMLNPVATLLTQMGHAFIGPDAVLAGSSERAFPAAATVAGAGTMLISVAIIPTVVALGWWFFTREAPRVAENL